MNYKLGLQKIKDKAAARYTLCKSVISLSIMGSTELQIMLVIKSTVEKLRIMRLALGNSFRHSSQVLTLILVLTNMQQLRRKKEIHLKV